MIEEIWKEIPNFPDYEISHLGRVKSLKFGKERILKPGMNNYGYLRVCLCNEAGIKQPLIHKLVGNAFIENPENKPEINHKNGDKTDNRIANLEWSTSSENHLHAYKTGLKSKKLTEKFVKEIFQLSHSKLLSQIEIAKRYGISQRNVSYIKNGKLWAHITEGGI